MNPSAGSGVNWNEVLFLVAVFAGLIAVLVAIIALAVRGQRKGRSSASGAGAGGQGASRPDGNA